VPNYADGYAAALLPRRLVNGAAQDGLVAGAGRRENRCGLSIDLVMSYVNEDAMLQPSCLQLLETLG
jgi:hypothetical protein